MKAFFVFLFSVIIVLLPQPTMSRIQLTVSPKTVLSTVSRQSIGVNTNYLMDGAKDIQSGLATLKVGAARYPGGEKSDSYLWSVAPFEQSQPTLSRTGINEWPSGDRTLMNADGSFVRTPLDFDAFMVAARANGIEPVLVVDFDASFNAATEGGTAPTQQLLLDTAVAWVKYANITKGYGVKYWEIGNESYQGSFNGSPTAQQYADGVKLFAQAMKAIDPSIKIGVNGGNDAWWATVIGQTSPYIDFLIVHNYPAWDWASYSPYASKTTLTSDIDRAIAAINNFAQAADKPRLKIAITEYNALSWSGWGEANDTGHALVAFDILGQQLQYQNVMFSLFWNTRWITGDSGVKLFDALKADNTITPVGQTMPLFANYMHDTMVKTSPTTTLRVFSSRNTATGALTIWIINKKSSSQSIRVTVQNYAPSTTSVQRMVFRGTSPTDTAPTLQMRGALTISSGNIDTSVDAYSITVLQLSGKVQ